MNGKVTRIKADDVKVIQVPHFKGLKLETMFEWAAQHPEVMQAFPLVQRERDDLPRTYVANIINTLKPDEFKGWVDQKVNERNEARQEQQDVI